MENKPLGSQMWFFWILRVVYFPVKHSCLSDKGCDLRWCIFISTLYSVFSWFGSAPFLRVVLLPRQILHMVRTETWILEKVFAQQYFRPVKRLEKGDEVGKNGKKSWVFIFAKLQQVLYKWIFFSFWSALIQYRPYVWLVKFCYVCMFCCAVRVHCLKTDNTWNTSIIKYLEWHSWTWIKIIMACSNNKLFQLP